MATTQQTKKPIQTRFSPETLTAEKDKLHERLLQIERRDKEITKERALLKEERRKITERLLQIDGNGE